MDACLDEKTTENAEFLWNTFKSGPSAWFHDLKNINTDFTMFDAYAEVMSDVASCHFETPFFALSEFCSLEENSCSFSSVAANANQGMMPLLGRLSDLAE